MRVAAVLLLALTVAACRRQPPAPPPVVEVPVIEMPSPWPGVVTAARRAAGASQWEEADSILAAFEAENPDAPETAESAYLRLLIRVDRATQDSTSRAALEALDGYLAAGEGQSHFIEARVLRRLIVRSDSVRAAAAAARNAADARATAREEEYAKLREEHERVQAELERIKRRLTGRPPAAPPATPP